MNRINKTWTNSENMFKRHRTGTKRARLAVERIKQRIGEKKTIADN